MKKTQTQSDLTKEEIINLAARSTSKNEIVTRAMIMDMFELPEGLEEDSQYEWDIKDVVYEKPE